MFPMEIRQCSLCLFFLLLPSLLAAQNTELDSLETVLLSQSGNQRVQTLNAISWHYRQSDTRHGMELAREALQLSQQLRDKTGMAASFESVGAIFEVTGAFDSALFYFDKSLTIKKELNDSSEIASSLNGIAMVYDQLGSDEKALNNYFDALRVFEALGDQSSQAMVLVNIGIVYKKQKEYSKVLEYYKKALDIYESQGSAFGTSVVRGNIGAVLLKMDDYRQSINYSLSALQGYERLGYKRLSAYPLGNLGIAYDSLGQHQEARHHYLEALSIHRDNSNQAEVAFTLKNLASHELKTGQLADAYRHASEAREIAEAIKADDILMQTLSILINYWAESGGFEKAFSLQQQYNAMRDKTYEEEKTRAVFELETKYETEKKDRAIESQRLSLIEKDLEIQKSRMTQLALVGAVLFLVVFGLLVRARIKLHYQRKLEEQRLLRQEELLRAVISSIEGERKRFSEDLHDGFGQLISLLKLNVDSLSGMGAPTSPQDRQRVFDQSVQVLNEMYGELKNVCFNLMPKTLVQHGLPDALRELMAKINQTGRVKAESHFYDLDERLADIQEISLYRIVQEWTSNILKYSDSTSISLQITRDDQEITLTVEDNGMGFDAGLLKEGKGNGWKNLQSRTNLMRGAVEIETTPGRKGSMLIVNVPAFGRDQGQPTKLPTTTEALFTWSLF